MSSPPFFLRDSRASETQTRVKITPREKRRRAAGRDKNESLPAACRLCAALPHFFSTTFLEIEVFRSEDWDLVHQTLSANRSGTMFDLCEGLVADLCYWLLLTLY